MKLIQVPITGGRLSGLTVPINTACVSFIIARTAQIKLIYLTNSPGDGLEMIPTSASDNAVNNALSTEPFISFSATVVGDSLPENTVWVNKACLVGIHDATSKRRVYVWRAFDEQTIFETDETAANIIALFNA